MYPPETAPVSVSIQGQEGSYHDEAASFYFGDAYRAQYLQTFGDVFSAVATGNSDYGVTAVENSIVGSIVPVYDLLQSTPSVSIQGEVFLGIHHSLIGLPGAPLNEVRDVYSHPVALEQCTDFLREECPQATKRPFADTVSSVAHVQELGDPRVAAIAGARNADRYGLAVLRHSIENNPENYTRFLVLGRTATDDPARRLAANKTSLFVERLTNDADELAPGTLYAALGCFAMAGVSLSKIESRPVLGRPWRYNFYMDCMAGAEDPRMQSARQALYHVGAVWRELGTYQAGQTVPTSA